MKEFHLVIESVRIHLMQTSRLKARHLPRTRFLAYINILTFLDNKCQIAKRASLIAAQTTSPSSTLTAEDLSGSHWRMPFPCYYDKNLVP